MLHQVDVCFVLLISLWGPPAAENLESGSDPQSSPDDGCLDRHLNQNMNNRVEIIQVDVFGFISDHVRCPVTRLFNLNTLMTSAQQLMQIQKTDTPVRVQAFRALTV